MISIEDFFHANLNPLKDAPLYRSNPTFSNPAWGRSPLHALVLRLSPFRDVQRSSPHLFLFREIRGAVRDSYIDMAFLPETRDRALFAGAGVPLILGTQSHRPLSDFDIVLVSLSCIPELVNLPYLLLGSGLPLWASERDEGLPPVILGGSSSPAAHGILKENGDCMADALFFGEGEGAVGEIVSLWMQREGLPKRERLAFVADRVRGLWPAGDPCRSVRRAVAPADSEQKAGIACPILPGSEAGAARLEITRGCPCLCTFCFEGHDRKPFRQLSVDSLMSAARRLKTGCGAETLEISGFNFNTHEGITDIILSTNRIFARVNAMSQRADILAGTPGLLDAEIAAGKRSYTIGIEGVSGALRRFLHKSLEEPDVRRVVEALHERKAREIKLFYLLTGRESDADFLEFSRFTRWLKELRRINDGGPRVIFSFGLLVRMPFTPLRYDGLILDRWQPLIGRVKSLVRAEGFEFRLAAGVPDYRLIQVLAASSRETAGLVEELAAKGIVYDGRFPPEAQDILARWLARHEGLQRELSAEKPETYRFPFPFLESAEERAFLYSRYLKAKAGIDEGYCRRGRPADCGGCTLCTLAGRGTHQGATRQAGQQGKDAPGRSSARTGPAAEIAHLLSRKARLKPIFLGVEIPAEAAVAGGAWLDAYLLQCFCALHPDQTDNVLSVREIMVSPWLGAGYAGSWFGSGILAVLAWDADAAAGAVQRGLTQEGEEAGTPPRFRPLDGVRSPGSFTSLRLTVELPRRRFPEAEKTVEEALRAMHVPFTAERDGDGYRMVVARKALGKKIILDGRYRSGENALSLELEVGPKMDVGALFGGEGVVIRVTGYRPA